MVKIDYGIGLITETISVLKVLSNQKKSTEPFQI